MRLDSGADRRRQCRVMSQHDDPASDHGKRSKREGILEVIRELDVRPETLRALYEGELDAVERDLLYRQALGER